MTDEDGAPVIQGSFYQVPVPEELRPWSTYPVDDALIEWEEGELTITYQFPIWLVGTAQRVEMEGTYDEDDGAESFRVSAEGLGDGECHIDGSRMECTERLPGIVVDRAMAENHMRDAGLSDFEIAQRVRVADVFAVDPIGIFVSDPP